MYIIMCVLCWGSRVKSERMSERKSRKDGRRRMRAEGGVWGKTDSCRELFSAFVGEKFPCCHFFYVACMSFTVYTIKTKDFFNLYLSFYAAKFAYTIKLKIAVCLKLSTVKWIFCFCHSFFSHAISLLFLWQQHD